MRHSRFNNPMFAEGLGGLISQFIGNPQSAAQAELIAAQALNENMTAQFRDAMGVGITPGMSPLGQMFVRSAQAGSNYSGNIVGIGKAIRQDERGILGLPVGRGGAGSRASPKLTQSALDRLDRSIRNSDTPEEYWLPLKAEVLRQYGASDGSKSLDEFAATLITGSQESERVIGQHPNVLGDQQGSVLGDMLKWWSTDITEKFLDIPGAPATGVPAIKTGAIDDAEINPSALPSVDIASTPSPVRPTKSLAELLDQHMSGGLPTEEAPIGGIPDGAIQLLLADPSLAENFDLKYGAGAAAKVLGR